MPVAELRFTEQELKVVRMLQDDPNRSRKEVARECGISQPTLSKLIKRIRDEGGFHRMNVLVLNPLKFGVGALAFFRVECEYKAVDPVTQAVALMSEVQEVHQPFGAMNSLFLKVRGRSNIDLSDTQGKIRALEGVREVRVDPVISKKEETDLPI